MADLDKKSSEVDGDKLRYVELASGVYAPGVVVVPIANSEATVFASAARTASANSADQTNERARGVHLTLDITAVSGTVPTLDVKVQAKDSLSGAYVDIPGASFAQKSAVGTDTLQLYPGIAETANREVSVALPRLWRVVATIGGTMPSFTFSVGASYIG